MAGTNAGAEHRSRYKGTSLETIRHQYDFLGKFYRLMVGADLVYSYGMWEDGDTLESAQLRKLDHLTEAANASGAHRVLDVGSGWGSLMRRLVEQHGVEHVVGLTMSPAQAAWVREQGWPGCESREENWFDHVPDAPYDAVFAIEAIEHFAGNTLSRAKRVARYRTFFEACHSWLRPGGRLTVQANAWNTGGWASSLLLPAKRPRTATGDVVQRRPGVKDLLSAVRNVAEGMHASRTVYSEVFLPTRGELEAASKGLFTVTTARSDPRDGIRTLESWLDRAEANRAEGVQLIGRKAVSDVIRQQRTALRFMREGRYTVLRMTFEKA